MKLYTLVLSLFVMAVLNAATAQDDAVKKELAKFQGVWKTVQGEEDGKPSSEYLVDNLKWVIKNDQLTFKGIEPLLEKASRLAIVIDGSTTPKCIDLKVEAGSLKGTVFEGVYEWKGDELKMCFFLAGGNRPLDFETKAGSNRVLFVLKRHEP